MVHSLIAYLDEGWQRAIRSHVHNLFQESPKFFELLSS